MFGDIELPKCYEYGSFSKFSFFFSGCFSFIFGLFQDVNKCNAVLLKYQLSNGSFRDCVQALSNQNIKDGRLLHFAANTVNDKLYVSETSCIPANEAIGLLKVVKNRFGNPSYAPLNLALQKIVGKIAALYMSSQWKTCVKDCLSMGNLSLGFGALEQLSEFIAKYTLPKSTYQPVLELMKEHSVMVCMAAKNAMEGKFRKDALQMMVGWMRLGCIPAAVIVNSQLIESTTMMMMNNKDMFSCCMDLLMEVFAPAKANLNSVKHIAKFSLGFDLKENRKMTYEVSKHLLVLAKDLLGCKEKQKFDELVKMICSIVYQHISLVRDTEDKSMVNFLLACLERRDNAIFTVPVWNRLEESIKEDSVQWAPLFSMVLDRVLKVAVFAEEARELRMELSDVILNCALVMGEEAFFQRVKSQSPNIEVALFAVSHVASLHNGRTAFSLPELFKTALSTNPKSLNGLAESCCNAVFAYRLFIKNSDMSSVTAQYCASCISICPNQASKAFLALAELCSDTLAKDLPRICPLFSEALFHVDEDTSVLLVGGVAELMSSIPEASSVTLASEFFDVILDGIFKKASDSDQRMAFISAGIEFCNRANHRYESMFLQRLGKVFPLLSQMMSQNNDHGSLFLGALVEACGLKCVEMYGPIVKELLAVMRKFKSSSSVRAFQFFAALSFDGYTENERGSRVNYVWNFVKESMNQIAKFITSCTEEDHELIMAFYDVMKFLVHNDYWMRCLGASDSPLYASLVLVEKCSLLCSSSFECMASMMDFHQTVFEKNAKDKKQPFFDILQKTAPALLAIHIKRCLEGNPLVIRFHVCCIFDCLRFLPKELSYNVFCSIAKSSSRPLAPEVADRCGKLFVAIEKYPILKSFLSDVSNIAKGRETTEALDSYK